MSMSLQISSFADIGQLDKERLVIKVLEDIDIGEYAVFYSRVSSEGTPTSGAKRAYWFPDGAAKSGDLVVLYTKRGTASTKNLTGGRVARFYYWGYDNALWGSDNAAAVVLGIAEWAFERPT